MGRWVYEGTRSGVSLTLPCVVLPTQNSFSSASFFFPNVIPAVARSNDSLYSTMRAHSNPGLEGNDTELPEDEDDGGPFRS